jgi:hypothetical protein
MSSPGSYPGASLRRRAGSRSAWCRASASALTRAYLASDLTEVWPLRAISMGVPVPSSASWPCMTDLVSASSRAWPRAANSGDEEAVRGLNG